MIALLGTVIAEENFTCNDTDGAWTEEVIEGTTTVEECKTAGDALVDATKDQCLKVMYTEHNTSVAECSMFSIDTPAEGGSIKTE